MKILIVMPSGNRRGGAEEALVQFCRVSKAEGCLVTVVLLESGSLHMSLVDAGVQVSVHESGRLRQVSSFFRSVKFIRQLIRQERPEVVLGWMTKAHIYGGLAALLERVPAVYFQHGFPDSGRIDLISRLIPAAGALACSEAVARAQRCGVSHRVSNVFAPLPAERFTAEPRPSKEECRQLLSLPVKVPIIGIVGRLQRWKGMHVFISALEQLRNHYPEIIGIIVGGSHHLEPDYQDSLELLIQQRGLDSCVRLVGSQTDIPRWMGAMDVVVHASEREPFGMVVIEAMALGRPVVATKPGGPEEVISDGIDGLLVPWNEASAMSAAIRRFLDDPALASACGKAAAARAQAFTAEQYGRKIRESLARMLAQQPATDGRVTWLIVMPSGRGPGGAEEMFAQFMRHSHSAGIDAHAVFLEPGQLALETQELWPETRILARSRLRNPLSLAKVVLQLIREIRRLRPAIVLSWMTKGQIYSGLAARVTGVPSFCFQRGLPHRDLVDRASRLVPCDGFLACSEFVAQEQSSVVSVPTRAVCSAVDLKRMNRTRSVPPAEWRVRLGLPTERIVVMIVGRLQRWKGMHVFVEAIDILRQTRSEILGVIVGGKHDLEPDYPTELEHMIQQRKLKPWIKMVDSQRNAHEWMQASDVMVHASEREPFGIVVLEAMALGKPVVATTPGGPREVITDGVDGLLVPYGSALKLAEALLRLLESETLAREMGLAAMARARAFDGKDYPRRVRAAIDQFLVTDENSEAVIGSNQCSGEPRKETKRPQMSAAQ